MLPPVKIRGTDTLIRTALWCGCFWLLTACSHLHERGSAEPPARVAQVINEVQQKHAPDKHLAIFNITATSEGSHVVLQGEVDNPDAKRDLFDRLTNAGLKIDDRIEVLPNERLGDRTWALVRISVSNLREEPRQGAELGAQVMMGHAVRIWKAQGGFYRVQSSDGYLGWTEDDVLFPCTEAQVKAWNSSPRLIVTAYEDRVWQKPEPDSNTFPVSDVVAGVLVKKTGEEKGWFKVELPDGRVGYLAKTSALDYDTWKTSRQATPENIERTAKSLLGRPYLWGGNTTKGMDCSGFTKLVYFLNGIELARNASHQVRRGKEVPIDPELKNLKKGDLLFFGFKNRGGQGDRIIHVGIYLEDKLFIQSSGMVRISSLDPNSPILDAKRLRTLVQARRYLPE